jgi:hypothetical protein
MTPDDEALLRRCKELTRDFKERHPAKPRAADFVNGLIEAARAPVGAAMSRADRDRERAAAELFVRYDILSDLFKSASMELEEYFFPIFVQCLRAVYELGIHAAPDGRAARAAREGSGDSKFINLVSIVQIYCQEHGIEPKASASLPISSGPPSSNCWACNAKRPSVSALVTALRAIRRQTLTI